MNITAASRAFCRLDWIATGILIFATCTISLAGVQAADLINSVGGPVAQKPGQVATQTPIKHLIVIVGENHSFDNVFATYVSPDPTQQVWNLLSRGIVNQSGGPGPNFSTAIQNRATDTIAYSLSPTQTVELSKIYLSRIPRLTLFQRRPVLSQGFLQNKARIPRVFNFARIPDSRRLVRAYFQSEVRGNRFTHRSRSRQSFRCQTVVIRRLSTMAPFLSWPHHR
jgi:hypothetical protein